MPNTITLNETERVELMKRASNRTGRAEDARRARLVLLLADGHTWAEVCDRLACSRGFVDSWSKRLRLSAWRACIAVIAVKRRAY